MSADEGLYDSSQSWCCASLIFHLLMILANRHKQSVHAIASLNGIQVRTCIYWCFGWSSPIFLSYSPWSYQKPFICWQFLLSQWHPCCFPWHWERWRGEVGGSFHYRYLRLTIVYAIGSWQFILVMAIPGQPLYIILAQTAYSVLQKNCECYWWMNLLHTNNLYPWELEDECLGCSWNLQWYSVYVIAPLIIILFIGLAVSGVEPSLLDNS